MNQIVLTRDELLVLLALIGVRSMDGLPEDPTEGVSQEELAIRLNSGEQTLTERGLLEFRLGEGVGEGVEEASENGEEQVILDETVLALAGAAATPEATLLVNRLDPDGSNAPHYFHVRETQLVEHGLPRPGIHHFVGLADFAELRQRVDTFLEPLNEIASPSPQRVGQWIGDVQGDALGRFFAAGQEQDPVAARKALVEGGMSEPLARQMAEDYVEHPSWVAIAGWGLGQEEEAGIKNVVAIAGEDRCWLLQENAQRPAEVVSVTAANGPDCRQAILKLIGTIENNVE